MPEVPEKFWRLEHTRLYILIWLCCWGLENPEFVWSPRFKSDLFLYLPLGGRKWLLLSYGGGQTLVNYHSRLKRVKHHSSDSNTNIYRNVRHV